MVRARFLIVGVGVYKQEKGRMIHVVMTWRHKWEIMYNLT